MRSELATRMCVCVCTLTSPLVPPVWAANDRKRLDSLLLMVNSHIFGLRQAPNQLDEMPTVNALSAFLMVSNVLCL